MKRLAFVFAVVVSGFVNSQDYAELSTKINNSYSEISYRREISGYEPNNDIQFNPILKKLIEKNLNIDSLIKMQPHLHRMRVNEDWTSNKLKHIIPYLTNLDLDPYMDTTKYHFKYDQTEMAIGDMTETLVVTSVIDNRTILMIHIQYETYSNLIYGIITN